MRKWECTSYPGGEGILRDPPPLPTGTYRWQGGARRGSNQNPEYFPEEGKKSDYKKL